MEDPAFEILFWIESTLVASVNLVLMLLFVRQLYITFRYAQDAGWTKWNVNTYAITSCIVGTFLRFLFYAVDPQSVRRIFNAATNDILFNLSIILYFQAAMMLFLYWVELQKGQKDLVFISKYRLIWITSTVVITLVVLVVCIWSALSENSLKDSVVNGFFAVLFIVITVVSSWGGFALIRIMKGSNIRLTGSVDPFVRKMFVYILASDVIWMVAMGESLPTSLLMEQQSNGLGLYLRLFLELWKLDLWGCFGGLCGNSSHQKNTQSQIH